MLLPSKELLSEVLGIDVDKVKGIEENTLIYVCVHSCRWYDEINIYELAHKCKEWAYKNHQSYISSWVESEQGVSQISSFLLDVEFIEDTEPEAIFKACEWIMEQTK